MVGSRLIRRCICEMYPAGPLGVQCVPAAVPPGVYVVGQVRRRVRVGARLFPGLAGPSFAGRLGSAARRFGWERADRLGGHIIRRRAARAILAAGGSLAQLFEVARRHSSP